MTSVALSNESAVMPPKTVPLRRIRNEVPADGEGGLYRQSWYPIAMSSDVPPGQVIGRNFLDGRVAIFRGASGELSVVSAYCPHVGADLSVGNVVGEELRCAFHHWQYNCEGHCTKTAVGDPPPAGARLFRFPIQERYGIIWVFNGTEPLFDLPGFEKPESELLNASFQGETYNCDGWVFAANTPDMQHIKALHGFQFKHKDPHELVDWTPWGFRYKLTADHGLGPQIDWTVGITGTTIFVQSGMIDDWWHYCIIGFSCPAPGQHEIFLGLGVEKGDGTEESGKLASERLAHLTQLIVTTAGQDRSVLNSIRYNQGTLTRSDQTLARFLTYVRNFPLAHPSADFIR